MRKMGEKLLLISLLTLIAYGGFSRDFQQNQKEDHGLYENKAVVDEPRFSYQIVDLEEYQKLYSDWQWMHIGRLEKDNAGVDLKNIHADTDFSKIQFKHTSNFAYRLYSGDFLICTLIK